MNIFDTLSERGLIAQTTHEEEIRELIAKEKITCDFYDFLNGINTSSSRYMGEYMNQYSWAETTNQYLRTYINSRQPDVKKPTAKKRENPIL